MTRLFVSVLCILSPFAWGYASAQTLQTNRTIEFRLAEDAAAPGLIPAHIVGETRVVYLHREIGLDDRDIRTATLISGLGGDSVQIQLQPSGVKKFNAMATGKLPRPLAIIVRGRVISVPDIDGPMDNDLLEVAGAFAPEEAASLARALSRVK
jgi:preprotein translocase subunit SecD